LTFITFLNKSKIYDLYDKIYLSKFVSLEIHDAFDIDRLIEYITFFKTFYKLPRSLRIKNNIIDFKHVNEPIYFVDTNFNVKGYLQFCKELDDDKNETGRVYAKLFDCTVKTNVYEYIANVLTYKINKDKYTAKYYNITVSDPSHVNIIQDYIELYRHFYNPNLLSSTNDAVLTNAEMIKFNDDNFNVSGYITINNDCIDFSYCELPKNYTLQKYVYDIAKIMNKHYDSTNKLTLYNATMCGDNSTFSTLYNNRKLAPEELEKIFMDTFFHPQKESLWEYIKNLHYSPGKIWLTGQAPRMNILAYGPPGTGKSIFACRIAMATMRHIINVKISKHTKLQLRNLFQTPKIGDINLTPKEVVFVLDEFDTDIDRLLANKKCKEKQVRKANELIEKMLASEQSFDNNPYSRGFMMNPYNMYDDMYKYSNIKKVQSTNADKGNEQEKKDDADKPGKSEQKKFTVTDEITQMQQNVDSVSKVDKLITETTKTYEKINNMESDIVNLEDLLTIFQGSVPVEGSIIIAMTNNYERIKEYCPALFRHGRLTPVYFGYFDKTLLNKVSKYYFGNELQFKTNLGKSKKKDDKTFCPAQVMEIVSIANLQPNGKFKYFAEKMHEIYNDVIVLEGNYEDIAILPSELSNFTMIANSEMNNSRVIQRPCSIFKKNMKTIKNDDLSASDYYTLGSSVWESADNPDEESKGFKFMLEAIKLGYQRGLYRVGKIYINGSSSGGTPIDATKGIQMLVKSIKAGLCVGDCFTILSKCYKDGNGVKKDKEMADKLDTGDRSCLDSIVPL